MAKKQDILRNQSSGFYQDLILRIKLIIRLMGDRRVSTWLKIIPIGALIYLISPIDLIPGAVIPFIGALDDAAVLWIGATLFVTLCPEEVVQEHMSSLQKVIPSTWRNTTKQDETEEVIDAEAHEVSQDH
jgi:uncharacterized membrane protein YkvA (DUF1232 family)